MTHRMYGALIASVGIVALMLGANETFARSASRAGVTSTHSMSRPSAHAFRHHRRNNGEVLWPGDALYGSTNGEPAADATPPASGDVHYTYTYDVPWDWAHRLPPSVAPSDRAYVPNCSTEIATVPGHNGQEQAVNVTRCY